MLFLSPDENNEALAGCNDVAAPQAGVVHGPLAGRVRLFLFGGRRDCSLRARVRDEFFGPAPCTLHPAAAIAHA
jgi:hypothetical protein